MNKILKTYEVIFLSVIYVIVTFYSIRAMINLIDESENASNLLKVILLDTFWLTIIVALGALLVSVSFNYKNKRRR
jgi:amino acid transporter